MLRLITTLILAGTMLSPTSAFAQIITYNYTFAVPVTVTSNAVGTVLEVSCRIFDTQSTLGSGIGGNAVDSIPLTAGVEYNRTIYVAVASPRKPIAYRCGLIVHDASTITHIYNTTETGWTGTMATSGAL